MKIWIRQLQRHARQWWYAPAIGFLAFIDHFTVIIPTDGLLVSAVMLNPRRWISTFCTVALFSSAGALVLAGAVQMYGLQLLLHISPGLDQTGIWNWTMNFMGEYGVVALFAIALSPIMQHPALALAALTGVPLLKIFLVVLLARLIKYGLYSWIATHTPHLIRRLWGLRGELEEVQAATPPEGRAG